MPGYYFDDYKVGQVFQSETKTLTASDIIAFAVSWDPQPIHLDPAEAADSSFGGIIASGLHTFCLCIRMWVDMGYQEGTMIAGAGIDKLNWTLPVRPGDALKIGMEVLETRASRSKPDRGLVRFGMTATNQNDETVMTLENSVMFYRRAETEDTAATG